MPKHRLCLLVQQVQRLLLPLLTCLAPCGLAAAQDLALSSGEVRILGGIAPGIKDGVDDSDRRVGSDGELLALYRLPVGRGPVSLILGGGVFSDARRARVHNPDDTASYDAEGVVLTVGARYALPRHVSLEARVEGRGGAGRFTAKQTFSNGDFEVLGNYGRYVSGAATIGAYYTFAIPASFGLEAGFDSFRGKSDFVGHAVSVRGDGLLVRLGLGFGF